MKKSIEKIGIKKTRDDLHFAMTCYKEREAIISRELAELGEKKGGLMAKWQAEKNVLDTIRKEKEHIERLKLEAEQAERAGDYGKVAEIRYGKLLEAENHLKSLQKAEKVENQTSMLQEEVTAENIAEVVAKWTGIPVSKMMRAEQEKLLHMEEELSKRVAGQEEAIQAISDAVRRSRDETQRARTVGSMTAPWQTCSSATISHVPQNHKQTL